MTNGTKVYTEGCTAHSKDRVMGSRWSRDQYQPCIERAETSLTFNTKLICFYYTPLERLLHFLNFFPAVFFLFPPLNPLLLLCLPLLFVPEWQVWGRLNVIYENKTIGPPWTRDHLTLLCLCAHACVHLQMSELTFTSLYYPLRSCMNVGSRNWSHQNCC